MYRVIHLLFCLLIMSGTETVFGQPSTISGVINLYTPVSAIDSLGCNAAIVVSNTLGFTAGDRVLIIQMKGASIDTTNTPGFGSIIDLGNAGNYEFANIVNINGDTIILARKLNRTYTISGLVQLIKAPQYTDVDIVGALTAEPWNGATGGVLVFEATGTVTMNANIDVSGLGFRGGDPSQNVFIGCFPD